MDRIRNRMDIRISGAAFLTAALMLLILPLKWLVAAVVAAAWHEVCHIIAVLLAGGQVHRISLSDSGAVLQTGNYDIMRCLFCVLAGPLGGVLPIVLLQWFPRFAICALIFSLYNLLPIYPLDGGRALRCIQAALHLPELFCVICEHCILVAVICTCLYATFALKLGLLPVILAVTIVLKTKSVKTLAN